MKGLSRIRAQVSKLACEGTTHLEADTKINFRNFSASCYRSFKLVQHPLPRQALYVAVDPLTYSDLTDSGRPTPITWK